MLEVGNKAPAFFLKDKDGKIHTLTDARRRWLFLYFYPKDDTPGCTKEACAMRDSTSRFKDLHAVVFGVSADSEESHRNFAEKYKLPFTLLSDPERKAIVAYGADEDGKNRISYLIDPHGVIMKAYEKVNPDSHAEEVLRDLKELKK